MPLVNIKVGDVKELEIVEADEYLLRVAGCEYIKKEKDGNTYEYLSLLFRIAEHPGTKLVRHTLWIPKPEKGLTLEQKEMNDNTKRKILTFAKAFELPMEDGNLNFDTKELEGSEGWGRLKIVEDEEYGKQNEVSRFQPRQ